MATEHKMENGIFLLLQNIEIISEIGIMTHSLMIIK
jgi:hypothetical protein